MTLNEFNTNILPLKNKLFRFALSVVANRELAEDVVQDAFIKIWKKRDELESILNIEAWSMRMVKNLCLDHFKSKHYRNSLAAIEVDSPSMVATPHRKTELSDSVNQVFKLMEDLPDQQRQVLKMRDIEEYSYKEIAEILEIDINLVKVNLHRARKSIRQKIEKNEAYGL